MFDGFTPAEFNHDGVVIPYVSAGQGAPVLLLHGFPQTHAMWAKIAPVLAKSYQVICPDLRGYGAASKPKNVTDYSFRAMGSDQLALMSSLGFDRFHLIGHDRGARTAHRMALDAPERVQSLTVMDIIPTHLRPIYSYNKSFVSVWIVVSIFKLFDHNLAVLLKFFIRD